MKKTMNHAEYRASLKSKSWSALWHIARDAKEAADANPEGINTGYYLDEVNYCTMEIASRGHFEVAVRDNDKVHKLFAKPGAMGPFMREVYPNGIIESSRPVDRAVAIELICGQ
jgi:hypothetical protein